MTRLSGPVVRCATAMRRGLALAVVAGSFALAACSRASGAERVTVRFWAMGAEADALRQLVRGFEREHPEIAVEVQQIPWTAAHEKLITAYVGDATPDIAQLG